MKNNSLTLLSETVASDFFPHTPVCYCHFTTDFMCNINLYTHKHVLKYISSYIGIWHENNSNA